MLWKCANESKLPRQDGARSIRSTPRCHPVQPQSFRLLYHRESSDLLRCIRIAIMKLASDSKSTLKTFQTASLNRTSQESRISPSDKTSTSPAENSTMLSSTWRILTDSSGRRCLHLRSDRSRVELKKTQDTAQILLTPVPSISGLTYLSPSVNIVSVSQPNRDLYRFGFDVYHLISALKTKRCTVVLHRRTDYSQLLGENDSHLQECCHGVSGWP